MPTKYTHTLCGVAKLDATCLSVYHSTDPKGAKHLIRPRWLEEIRYLSLTHTQHACMRRSVGVQGDQRTHSSVVALRAVTSSDGMTADWYPFEPKFLQTVSSRICNGVRSVNRVVYDITSKPPGTIEWE